MDTVDEVLSDLAGIYARSPDNLQKEVLLAHKTLQEALRSIVDRHKGDLEETIRSLDALASSVYVMMRSRVDEAYLHAELRQLYTDCCISRSLASLILAPGNEEDSSWLECIRTLDMALVFSKGPDREEIVHQLIAYVQQTKLPFLSEHPAVQPPATIESKKIAVPLCGGEVPVIEEPDVISFLSLYSKAPFVIRNGVSHWPALDEHPWSSTLYLKTVAGRGRVVPVEVGRDYRTDEWNQEMMDWEKFLAILENGAASPVYLAQHSLLSQFPRLRDDIQVPDLVYYMPSTEYSGYRPPASDDGVIINAWFGPKDTVSPAHKDPYFNCYAQVVGRKTVWLAPAHFDTAMYPLSSKSSLSNTTSLDVFSSENNDYPLFMSEVLPNSMSTTLGPGDLLFFPPGWWHAMRSEEKSFSISFWF